MQATSYLIALGIVASGGLGAAVVTRSRIGLLGAIGAGAVANYIASAVRGAFALPPLTKYGLVESFAWVFAAGCGILLLRRLILHLAGRKPDRGR